MASYTLHGCTGIVAATGTLIRCRMGHPASLFLTVYQWPLPLALPGRSIAAMAGVSGEWLIAIVDYLARLRIDYRLEAAAASTVKDAYLSHKPPQVTGQVHAGETLDELPLPARSLALVAEVSVGRELTAD